MTRLAIALAVVLIHVACLGGGSRPRVSASAPPTSATASELQGEWELVSLEAQGQPRRASGRLSFDPFNHIEVRAELAPDEPGVTPPRVVLLDFSARATASAGRLNYVGLERRAPADQMVLTASEPSDWRYYAVEGDTLRIWQESDGARVGVLTFRRVR